MSGDHVVVVVGRKVSVHSVAGLGRFSVADAIGENHEILRSVQRLAGAKKLASELRREKLCAGAARSMKDQDRIVDASLCVSNGLAEGAVMQPEFCQ